MLGARSTLGALLLVAVGACGGHAMTESAPDSAPVSSAAAPSAGGGAFGGDVAAPSGGGDSAATGTDDSGDAGSTPTAADISDETATQDSQRLCSGLQHNCPGAANQQDCVSATMTELITEPAACWALARAYNECCSTQLPPNVESVSCDEALSFCDGACASIGRPLHECKQKAYANGQSCPGDLGTLGGDGSCSISKVCGHTSWTLTCQPSGPGESTRSCMGDNVATKAVGNIHAQGSQACSIANPLCGP
jgi:hypothetical protein